MTRTSDWIESGLSIPLPPTVPAGGSGSRSRGRRMLLLLLLPQAEPAAFMSKSKASSDLRLAGAEPSRSLLRSVAECGSPPRRRQFSHREALRQRVSLFLFRCSCSPLPALRLPRAEPRPPPPPPRKAIARHGKRDLPPLISLQTAPIRRARACGSRFPV